MAARSRGTLGGVVVIAALVLAYLIWQRHLRDAGEASAPAAVSAAPSSASRSVRYPGGTPQRIDLSRAERTVEDGIGAISGTVLSRADDRPIPHAQLSFASGSLHSVSADAEGNFRFAPPHTGSYELALVTAPSYLPFAPEYGHSPMWFHARRGAGVSGARIYLTFAVDYTALVVAPDDTPVGRATLYVLGGSAEGASLAADDSPPPLTNAQGEALFFAPDEAIVEARHPDFNPGRARVDFSVQVGRRMRIQLAPLDAARRDNAVLTGTVSAGGERLPSALVVARFEPDDPLRGELVPPVRGTSDDDGQFALVGLTPGRYTVVASAPGYAPGMVRGVPVPGKIDIALSEGAALRGRVTDAGTGQPIAAFAVIVNQRRGPIVKDIVAVEPTFDPDGRYEIPALAEGTYLVTVSASGYATAPEREVSVEQDASADFALARGGSVKGIVIDARSEAPIAGAKISLEGWLGAGGDGVGLHVSATSDAEGHFELFGVGGGRQSLMVAASGHHGRLIQVDLPPGGIEEVRVALTPTEGDEQPRIELVGIGAVLSANDDALVIGKVIEGGGAEAAGLVAGDAIVAVDGVLVVDLGFAEAITRIRGPEESIVVLAVRKVGADAPIDVQVMRRRIRS